MPTQRSESRNEAVKTAVLRIGELAGQGYPVELLLDDGTRGDWRDYPLASGSIPADWQVPNPPPTTFRDAPLTVAEVRQLLL